MLRTSICCIAKGFQAATLSYFPTALICAAIWFHSPLLIGQTVDELRLQVSEAGDTEKVDLLVQLMELSQNDAADQVPIYAEQALALLKTNPDASQELAILLGLARCHAKLGDTEKALDYAQSAETIAVEIDDQQGLGRAKYNIALAHWYLGKTEQAIEIAQAACDTYRKIDDQTELATAYTLLGVIYRSRGDFRESIDSHNQSLEISTKANDQSGICRAKNNLGLVYWKLDQHERAMEYLESILPHYRESGSKSHMLTVLNNLGLISIELGQPDKAIALLEEGLALNKELPKSRASARLYSNMGFAYEEKEDFEVALKHHNQALEIRRELKDGWGCSRSLGCIGGIQARFQKHNQAIKSYEEALLFAQEFDAMDEQAELNFLLAESLQTAGRLDEALAAFKKHHAILRDLNKSAAAQRIAELEAASKLAEQNQYLAEQRQKMAEQNQRMAEQNQKLAEQNQQMAEQKQQIAEQKSQVESLERARVQQTLKQSHQRSNLWLLVSILSMTLALLAVVIVYVQSRAIRSKKNSVLKLQTAMSRLQESETRYRCVFEDSPIPKFLIDLEEGSLVDLNVPATQLMNLEKEQAIGRKIESLPSKWLCDIFQSVDPSQDHQIESKVHSDQANRSFEMRATPIRVQGRLCAMVIVQDVTEQHQREGERIKLEKMESLGVLAGGIAHDFRNALTAIMGYVSIARLKAGKETELDHLLERAELAGEQADWLTSQLVTFSKGGAPQRKAHDLYQLIVDAVNLGSSGSRLEIKYDLATNLPGIVVDEGQFKQVISNLVINAHQAMEEGGHLTVRARTMFSPTPLGPTASSGQYLCIEIQDFGPGIPTGIRDKVLDPYYTTKDYGSGLGLSTAFAIVQQHNGHMDFCSEEGEGTTFSLYFPAEEKMEDSITRFDAK